MSANEQNSTTELPDDAVIRAAVLGVDPLIVMGTIDFSDSGRNFTHPRLRAMLGDRPAYLLAILPWSHEVNNSADRAAELVRSQSFAFPHQSTYVLCNTEREVELFRERGVAAGHINHNIFIDQAMFRPDPVAVRRYEAIYVATMEAFKRHGLMRALGPSVLAYAKWSGSPEREAYYAGLRQQLPECHFANQPDPSQPYRFLPARDIAALCNQAHVGLCLSEVEGAMRASMEYLLCGLPVVSTPNKGGRDVFFDPAYALTAEPDPDAIARAVRELIDRQLDPKAVRAAVQAKVRPMRQNFVDLLREIHVREERPWPPAGYFRDPFCDPYEDVVAARDFAAWLAAAQARHETRLSTD